MTILRAFAALLLLAVAAGDAHAVRLTGTTSYAYNVNNIGGPDYSDSALACYWYNTNQIGTGTILQAVKYVNGVPYEMFGIQHKNQRVDVYMADEAGDAREYQTTFTINQNSTWNQVTILAFPAQGVMRIAVNGVERSVNLILSNGNFFNLPVASQTWTVGARGTTTGPVEFYSGDLDQVYFHAWDGVYDATVGMFTEACGANIGIAFAPIRPGPEGTYIVRDFGNPVPIIMLQGKSPGEFLYNHGGVSTFSGGQGMSTSPTDMFILDPLQ